jgi:type IV pilus assembly protein PilB
MADQDVFLQRALLAEGLVTNDQLDAARRYGAEHDVDLVDALIAMEVLSSRQIALVKADVCEVPYVELSDFEPCYANTTLISRDLADRYCAYPLFMIDGVLTLAMDDPLNLDATDHIRRIAKCDVDAVLSAREQIQALIAKAYSLGHGVAAGV